MGDFDPLPDSQVIGEKVSLHYLKLWFLVKTLGLGLGLTLKLLEIL